MIHRVRSGPGVLVWLAAVVAVVTVAGGCGSGSRPVASSPTSPSPTSPTDPSALLRASGTAMDTRARTCSFTMTYGSTASRNGVTSAKSMHIAGDVVFHPESMRAKGTFTLNGVTMDLEMIGVSSGGYMVGYLRLDGMPGWQRLPRDQADIITTGLQDTEEMLGAAKRVDIVRTESVGGVLCDVVQVDLDVAAYDKANKSLGLADSVSSELHIPQAEAVAALQNATGTELM